VEEARMADLVLNLDSKNRVSLTKLLKYPEVESVKATISEDGDIILKPMVSIPARERWLYDNKKALASVKKGLSQKATIYKGSFAKYAK
jgi:hypothetical protein